MKILIQHKTQGVLAATLAFLLLTGVITEWSVQQNRDTYRWVNRTSDAIAAYDDVLVKLLALESANLRFALLGDEKDYQLFQAGIVEVKKTFAASSQWTQANPGQQRRLAVIAALIQTKIRFANEVSQLRRIGDTAGIHQLIDSGGDRQATAEIRRLMGEMETADRRWLQQLMATGQTLFCATIGIVALGSMLAAGLVTFSGNGPVEQRTDNGQSQHASIAIVESSADAIIGKSLDGIITSWNSGAERMFGYTASEAMGRPMLMLFPPETVHEEQLILEKLSRGEWLDHYETRRFKKDGGVIDIGATISPVKDATGRIIGISQIARDITRRKAAEDSLQRAHDQLQSQVAELAMFNKSMVDREQRIIEMKEEVNSLCRQLGREPEYPPIWKKGLEL